MPVPLGNITHCRSSWPLLSVAQEFSLNAARAASAKLREFLALMPTEQREAAATQLASSPF